MLGLSLHMPPVSACVRHPNDKLGIGACERDRGERLLPRSASVTTSAATSRSGCTFTAIDPEADDEDDYEFGSFAIKTMTRQCAGDGGVVSTPGWLLLDTPTLSWDATKCKWIIRPNYDNLDGGNISYNEDGSECTGPTTDEYDWYYEGGDDPKDPTGTYNPVNHPEATCSSFAQGGTISVSF